jgi:hypothetical protein
MPETASLTAITRNAFQLVRKIRQGWLFALPAGFFIILGSIHPIALPNSIDPDALFSGDWFFTPEGQHFSFLIGLSLLISFGQALIRGPMLLALNRTAAGNEKSVVRTGFLRAALLSLFFQAAFWCLLFILGGVLFLPSYVAWRMNPESFPALTEIALILFLTLSTYLFFIKELTYFFALFGKTAFRSSVDLGTRLFRKHSFATVLFMFYAALLTLFSIILVDALLSSTGLFLPETNRWLIESAIGLPVFGYYFLFDQALRLAFFRSIATPPKERVRKEPLTKPAESAPGITPV